MALQPRSVSRGQRASCIQQPEETVPLPAMPHLGLDLGPDHTDRPFLGKGRVCLERRTPQRGEKPAPLGARLSTESEEVERPRRAEGQVRKWRPSRMTSARRATRPHDLRGPEEQNQDQEDDEALRLDQRQEEEEASPRRQHEELYMPALELGGT